MCFIEESDTSDVRKTVLPETSTRLQKFHSPQYNNLDSYSRNNLTLHTQLYNLVYIRLLRGNMA
jgi:hypothetical protein